MHVFMVQRIARQIAIFFRGRTGAVQTRDLAFQHGIHVRQCVVPGQQGQIPARIVVDVDGIVKRIGIVQHRRGTIEVAQGPQLVKIGDVADLPKQRVDGRQLRPDQLRVV